jgi:hypothetical protein
MPFLTQEEYLERAKQVLAILAGKGIKLGQESHTEEGMEINRTLNLLRNMTAKYREQLGAGANFAMSYALTELGFAACQEMGYRTALEYMLMFDDTQVCTVHAVNSITSPPTETHLFTLIGNSLPMIRGETINSYLERQPDNCIMIDGFFGQCDVAKNAYHIIQKYCNQYKVTMVSHAQSYAGVSKSQLNGVHREGNRIAEDIRPQIEAQKEAAIIERQREETKKQESENRQLILAKLQQIAPKFSYNSKQKGFYVSGEEGDLNKLKAEFESAGIMRVQILRNVSKTFLAIPEANVSVLPLIAMERNRHADFTPTFSGPK